MGEEKPTTVNNNLVVALDYTVSVDGNVIDSTNGSEPLEYLHGYGNIIPGLENALLGMKIGESKNVLVPAKDAYGEYNNEAFADLPRDQFPQDMELQIGGSLRVRTGDGHIMSAIISDIAEEHIRIDLNHPLAGKDMNFTASVIALRQATEEELMHGRVGGICGAGCGSSDCDSGGCGSGCCG